MKKKKEKSTDFHYLHCNSRFSIIIVIVVIAVTKVSNLWRQKWKFLLLINSVIGMFWVVGCVWVICMEFETIPQKFRNFHL